MGPHQTESFCTAKETKKKTKRQLTEWKKILSTAKETLNNTKRQPTEWEKIFANELTDKELISKICKLLYHSISKKQTTPSKNGQI